MQNWQHGAVARGVEVADALPGALQWCRLRLAVADDRGDDQVGVVEGRAEGVREHIAKLTALVDRSGRRHADVAGNAAGRGELAEESAHAIGALSDFAIDLGVRALEVDISHERRAAVPGPGEVDDAAVVLFDEA